MTWKLELDVRLVCLNVLSRYQLLPLKDINFKRE